MPLRTASAALPALRSQSHPSHSGLVLLELLVVVGGSLGQGVWRDVGAGRGVVLLQGRSGRRGAVGAGGGCCWPAGGLPSRVLRPACLTAAAAGPRHAVLDLGAHKPTELMASPLSWSASGAGEGEGWAGHVCQNSKLLDALR